MTRTILGMLAGTAFMVAGVAHAQQTQLRIMDGNNPAPNYGPSMSGPASQTNSKIMDGNNPSPNYPASATNVSMTTNSKIMDGNNPSPNYPGNTPAPQMHASHHHAHKAS